MALGLTQTLTEMNTRNISWGVERPVRRADNFTTFMCRLSWNLGASTSWKPRGLSRPVIGLLFCSVTGVVLLSLKDDKLKSVELYCPYIQEQMVPLNHSYRVPVILCVICSYYLSLHIFLCRFVPRFIIFFLSLFCCLCNLSDDCTAPTLIIIQLILLLTLLRLLLLLLILSLNHTFFVSKLNHL